MILKQIIVVRHGEDTLGYSPDGEPRSHLTREGKQDILRLSEKIKEVVKGKEVLIFSSPLFRACQSAEIISDTLGVKHEEKNELSQHDDFYDNLEKRSTDVLNLVVANEEKTEVLILVTHGETYDLFPKFFKEFFKEKIIVKVARSFDKGSGFILDRVEKTIVGIKNF